MSSSNFSKMHSKYRQDTNNGHLNNRHIIITNLWRLSSKVCSFGSMSGCHMANIRLDLDLINQIYLLFWRLKLSYWLAIDLEYFVFVYFYIINFSDFVISCIFWPALACWVIVYSDQLLVGMPTSSWCSSYTHISYHNKLTITRLVSRFIFTCLLSLFLQYMHIVNVSRQE